MENYILSRFGNEAGAKIMDDVKKRQQELERFCQGKSSVQQETMRTVILPRAALYLSLKESPSYDTSAYDVVWDYTKSVICAPKRKQYQKMQSIPGFYFLFKKMFLSTMLHSDNWDSTPCAPSHDGFGFTIHRCLWHDTCVMCGCPELCKVFCDSDWENFGGLKKVKFERTQAIGTGGEICDFWFRKSKK